MEKLIDVLAPAPISIKQAGKLDKAVDRFLFSHDVKKTTRSTYERNLRKFRSWYKVAGDPEPTRETILRYKRYLESCGLSPLTIGAYLTTVRKFFEWCEGEKIYPNIARGVKNPKQSRNFKKDPLTVDQVRELLASIDTGEIEGLRDYAMLNLMLRTALRTIEITRASIGDIRQESGVTVLDIQGKGRDDKDSFVVLTEKTYKPIRKYLAARKDGSNPKAPLFTSLSNRNKRGQITTRTVSRIVKTRLRFIDIDNERITAHSTRHTAVTMALMGGASLQEAQQLARHQSINTTMIYAHNLNRIENAAEYRIDSMY